MRYLFIFVLTSPCLISDYAISDTIYKCKSQLGSMFYQEKPCEITSKSISSWGSTAGAALILSQGSHGHYFVDGEANSHKINFVIDTGASVVSLPQTEANSAGLSCQKKASIKTGNGTVQVCTTLISTLKLGSFSLKDVEAVIAPNLGQALLGMNVLKRFRIEQDSGEMRLTMK